jgi:hypothetical protein
VFISVYRHILALEVFLPRSVTDIYELRPDGDPELRCGKGTTIGTISSFDEPMLSNSGSGKELEFSMIGYNRLVGYWKFNGFDVVGANNYCYC